MSTVAPPQWSEAFKRLELEAAWTRAGMLEEERDQAIMNYQAGRERLDHLAALRLAYERGILRIMQKYGPAAEASDILTDLRQLYDNPLGE